MKVTFDQKSRQRVYRLWDNRERRVDDLISHKDKIDRNIRSNFGIFAQYLSEKFNRLFGVGLTTEEVWHWFGVYLINSMAVGNRMSIDYYTKSPCSSKIPHFQIEFSGGIGENNFARAVYIDGSALNHGYYEIYFRIVLFIYIFR